jgi:predicted lipoprotein
MRMAVVVLSLMAFVLPVNAEETKGAEALAAAVSGYIQPGFATLATDSALMVEATDALCKSPGIHELAIARSAFKAVVVDHARVEFLRFGPLTEESRLERLLFWPDRKGIALRQVQAILANQDATATKLENLRGKSIAVQGLGALEYALFGEGADDLASSAGAFRCSYASAVTQAISATADELNAAWADPEGIAAHLSAPKPENDDYRSERESLEELVGAMAQGIEMLRDVRLLSFIGRDGEAPKPKSALFWRSGMTVPAIRAGFEGIRDLLAVSKVGQAAGPDDLWVDNSAKFELGNALRAADVVKAPVAEALLDPKQRKALDYIVILTGSLQTLLGENLPAALKLSVGFSSLDGD